MGLLAGAVDAINKAGPAPSGGQGNDGNGYIAQLMRDHPELIPRMKKGGKVSASSRADGIAQRGKTKGRMR